MTPIESDTDLSAPLDSLASGRYRLEGKLGGGANGDVYAAFDTTTGDRVAIKVLNSQLGEDAASIERFKHEARAVGTLRHSNIVRLIDLGEEPDGSAMFIVYERLRGHSLRVELDRRTRLSPVETAAKITPIMAALGEAHANGIVHRDVKPENVFLALDDRGRMVPKLIDFGIAKSTGSPERRTATGVTLGTPRYMSPEHLRGDVPLDARADIWSVGVVLYECVAGVRPFDNRSIGTIAADIMRGRFTQLGERVPGVPEPLAEAIHRALNTDRDRRYPTMQAFAEALTLALAGGRGDHQGP